MAVVSSLLVRVAALLHLIVAAATTSTGVINLDSNNGVYHGLTGDAVISTVEEIDSTGRRAIDLSASHLSEDDAILLLKRVLLQCVGRGPEREDDGDGDEIQPLSAAVKNLDLSMNRLSPSAMVAVIHEICQAQEDDTDDSHDTDSATSPALEELDLSMNDIGGHGANQPDERLLESFRKLFESRSACAPRTLILQNCSIGPAILRSIGRGILNRYEKNAQCNILSLDLGGNKAIGDAGAVALAAALRMSEGQHTFDSLDLSSCGVGDTGCSAIALAIASNPSCLTRRLDLSNNNISDEGAKLLGKSLLDARLQLPDFALDEVILDNNDIGDDSLEAIAAAFSCGAIKTLSLRSCAVKAAGCSFFGEAVRSLSQHLQSDDATTYSLDLSGNHFGTQQKKKKKGLGSVSASLIRDTATSNLRFIGKTLQGAAKSFGTSVDSDDDEDAMLGGLVEEDEGVDSCRIEACGAHSFASEFMRDNHDGNKYSCSSSAISIGMRQCFLEEKGCDALAATALASRHCRLSFDVSLNDVSEDSVLSLSRNEKYQGNLNDMAEQHMDLLNMLKSRQADFQSDFDETLFDDDYEY